ncbi:glycosyltransferase family 4 protein [Rhizobium laguerreae]|uniref:glycosyltransferase family 4 protein n=1 Tax=Rhizobium laguerreae TaxID=1076926 RepID=UPI001C8FCBF3|nr:glycosyltransferase family 4 protein [Rhizobium laguerreae]MBY3181039.1 glycosyltransferase family 4 protein [Rhizobium laguerreae]
MPDAYIENLTRADEVWTTTAWGADILNANGISAGTIRVVPEGVDTNLFRPYTPSKRSALFRFLFVGKWEERKGPRDLIRAFCKVFQPTEPVELVMHFGHSSMSGRTVYSLVREETERADCHQARVLVSTHLPLGGLIRLIQSSDVFVLPTRGEAWGLPIIEAMACGIPAIVTNYSGHLEYANNENSFLIEVGEMIPAQDDNFFPRDTDWGLWANPNFEHLCDLLRSVFVNQDLARSKGVIARRDVVRSWSWENAASIAFGHLQKAIAVEQ